MSIRPVDTMTIGLFGEALPAEMATALADVVDNRLLNARALIVIAKDDGGNVTTLAFDPFDFEPVDQPAVILNSVDLEEAGQALALDSSALLLIYEDDWAGDGADAPIDDEVAELQQIARLFHQGVLTNEEVSARTSRILRIPQGEHSCNRR